MVGPGAAVAIASPSADIGDFAFTPAELTVAAGTTVAWTNEDLAPHTATVEDGSFDSDRLDQGASFQHAFDEPRTFAYHCSFHPGKMGSIVVT
jgi:plastocyanin